MLMYGRNGHHTESNSPLIKNNIKKKKKIISTIFLDTCTAVFIAGLLLITK